jgi:hypothetical protein
VRYKYKSIASQKTVCESPLWRLSTGECHLIGYLVCTNTLCSIIPSLYAAIFVHYLRWSPIPAPPLSHLLCSEVVSPFLLNSTRRPWHTCSTIDLSGVCWARTTSEWGVSQPHDVSNARKVRIFMSTMLHRHKDIRECHLGSLSVTLSQLDNWPGPSTDHAKLHQASSKSYPANSVACTRSSNELEDEAKSPPRSSIGAALPANPN